jgi:hypothetical protein
MVDPVPGRFAIFPSYLKNRVWHLQHHFQD